MEANSERGIGKPKLQSDEELALELRSSSISNRTCCCKSSSLMLVGLKPVSRSIFKTTSSLIARQWSLHSDKGFDISQNNNMCVKRDRSSFEVAQTDASVNAYVHSSSLSSRPSFSHAFLYVGKISVPTVRMSEKFRHPV
ncbi:hypothetical protein HanIR_Chr06g0294951 [Helianthus annuus]|nr:hypothetical protein HanIR_Chr06g0294951 [Helianthus annuus]